ncbi:stage V sporulation protein AC [Hathewaya histolytica]|uniref:Stage V sporulation protein AC n=1 Tax=Hathewaya histolytica TaxID=1498 RepID=A0A4U9RMB0_HATHI|nr:stage V sporulation protein AC [Hathewaya histolytica]VTQ92628.1 stage V sporulation protein AC [Hathewaya histolytica]
MKNQNKSNKKKEELKDKSLREEFQKIKEEKKPNPPIFIHCIRAFWVGGLICTIGEFINTIYLRFGFDKQASAALVSITMIFLGAFLTGIGIYDKVAEYAGAGSVVPITGFSNSIVSPAMEFKKEGFVFGVAAKMFTIAGPVLVYGITSSVIVGIIYYFFVI